MRARALILILATTFVGACEDDDGGAAKADASASADAGGGAKADGGAGDAPVVDAAQSGGAGAARADGSAGDGGARPDGGAAGDGGGATDAPVLSVAAQRGQYLVTGVLGCVGCHTPRGAMGLDMTKMLSGVTCFRDTDPATMGRGCMNSSNLTNHATGLANRTDDQIKDMLRNGKRPDDKYLFTAMPWHLYHNLTDDDASAIVAYLRTVPGINNMLPANEAPWDVRPTTPPTMPVKPSDGIPEVPAGAMNVESARRGRYLAAVTCIECHSPELPMGMADKPYDVSKAFSGGREYTATINMMSRKVYSSNVTPDGTGIAGWTAADIVKVLKMGLDKMGGRTCTPMGTYPAMKDEDATDIANYLLALPAKMNQIPQQCAAM